MGSWEVHFLLNFYYIIPICSCVTTLRITVPRENLKILQQLAGVWMFFKVFGIIDSDGLNLTCIMNVFHYYEVWTFIVLAENSSHLVTTILPHREMKMKPLINLHH